MVEVEGGNDVTSSGVAMLRLAQKFGPYVSELKVTDYLEVPGADLAWDAVRFGDLLNMASGLGGGTAVAAPNDMYIDYLDESYDAWYTAPTLAGKVEHLGKVGAYPWGRGRWRAIAIATCSRSGPR